MGQRLIELLVPFLPLLGTVFAVALVLGGMHWLLLARHSGLGNERKFPRQLVMLGLTLAGILAIILVLPVGDSSRNQLIALMGILISGVLAFSSTTIVANLMAGLLLRFTKPFRIGDFIQVREYFGRVSERGLFDTEIQSETRDLIALPNTYLIGNPVTTTRSSGTIISASVSLGYDQEHSRIEPLLVEAAARCGLAEPFVHILELGNFAVTYRISGFLEESKHLISARSALRRSVLSTLHGNGIEIVSPDFMNQRRLPADTRVIPAALSLNPSGRPASAVEDIAFDKAESAERRESRKQGLREEIKRLETELAQARSEAEKKLHQEAIDRHRKQLVLLEGMTEPTDSEIGHSEPAGDGSSS